MLSVVVEWEEEAGDGLVSQQPQTFVQKFRCQWICIDSILSQMIMLYMVMIVYAIRKLHYFILLVLLLLISLFIMVYDCGSKCSCLPPNVTVCQQVWGRLFLTQWQWEHVRKARNVEGTVLDKQVDQWIPLEDLIELISQMQTRSVIAIIKYWCML